MLASHSGEPLLPKGSEKSAQRDLSVRGDEYCREHFSAPVLEARVEWLRLSYSSTASKDRTSRMSFLNRSFNEHGLKTKRKIKIGK